MAHKICCRCKQDKELDEFYPLKTHKDGHRSECKQCSRDKVKIYSKTEKGIKARKECRSKEPAKTAHNEAQKRYMQTDKGKKYQLEFRREYEKTERRIAYRKSQAYQNILKEWRETHKEEKHAKDKIYRDKRREENLEEVRFYFRNYHKNRSANDIEFKILTVLRRRVSGAITENRGIKCYKTKELLGCSIKEARNHIESLFTEGMSWDNYGYGNDKWNIDHIVPCAKFDLKDPEEQKLCFNWTNLQPLWQPENFTKGSKHNGVSCRKSPIK